MTSSASRAAPLARSESVGGVTDLAFTGAEDEDVARPLGGQLAYRLDDGLRLVELATVVAFERPVAQLDRIAAARDLDDRNGLPGPRQPAKWAAKRSVSMVADVMMTLRSGRRGSSCAR